MCKKGGDHMQVKMKLIDKGELAKTGCIYNENCPISTQSPGQIPIPDFPSGINGIFAYSIERPDSFYYQVPDGHIICKKIPEKPTIAYHNLVGVQLYNKVTHQPEDKWICWMYDVRHWYEQTTGQGQFEHREIVYEIALKLELWEAIPGDSLAPYKKTQISSTRTISGNMRINSYSNIMAFDQRYIGFVCHYSTHNDVKLFGIDICMLNYLYLDDGRWVADATSSGNTGIYVDRENFGGIWELDIKEKTDPNEEGGPGGHSGEGGGMGDRDDHSDPVPIPNDPTISATDAGFVTLYNPSLAELQAIGDELYTDTVWEAVKNFFKSPDEYVVGLGIIPVQPLVGASKHPKCGVFTFNTALPVVIHEYVTVDCGSIDITEFYGSAFDYAGMTSIQIYLPYIGFRDIDVDGAMGHSLGVVYKVDVYNGNCVAFITIDGSVHYTFSGNCIQQVPTAAQSFDNSISNGIALAAAVVGAVTTGGATAAEEAATGGAEMLASAGASAAADGAMSTASANAVIGSSMVNVMNSKPNVNRSGALGSSSGLMGVQYPYIIRKIPRQSWPDNYNEFSGYPCNMTVTLNNLSGFFVVDSINLSGISAMEQEIAEIMAYLKGGVIK